MGQPITPQLQGVAGRKDGAFFHHEDTEDTEISLRKQWTSVNLRVSVVNLIAPGNWGIITSGTPMLHTLRSSHQSLIHWSMAPHLPGARRRFATMVTCMSRARRASSCMN